MSFYYLYSVDNPWKIGQLPVMSGRYCFWYINLSPTLYITQSHFWDLGLINFFCIFDGLIFLSLRFGIFSFSLGQSDCIIFCLPCLGIRRANHLLASIYKIPYLNQLNPQSRRNFMDIQQAFSLSGFVFIWILPAFQV